VTLRLEELAGIHALKCPHCGSTYVHHDEVAIFERGEDCEKGLRVRVLGVDVIWEGDTGPKRRPASVLIEESLVGNPSARRQGVCVYLWCEDCRERSSLMIAQHKGGTYLTCAPVKETTS